MPVILRPRRNDEADRAVWPDLSGNGNDGTLTGFAFTEASGWATEPDRLVFAGDNDYVACPDLGAAEDGIATYEMWFTKAGPPAANQYLMSESDSTAAQPYFGMLIDTNGYLGAAFKPAVGGTAYAGLSGPSVCDGDPHHLVVNSNGSVLKAYVDSVPLALSQATPAPPHAFNATTLGALRLSSALFGPAACGTLAAHIYSTALSAADVAQNYAAGPTGTDYVRDGLVLDFSAARAVPVIPKFIYRSGQEAIAWQ